MTTALFTNQVTRGFDEGFMTFWSESLTVTPLTGLRQVSLGGVPYVIDTSFEPYRREAFRHRSLPSQRESLNTENIAGEGVVATSGLWRRDQIDWSLGAGQLFLDHRKSAENRFLSSKGVDVMTTQWQMSLLNDTTQAYTINGSFHRVKPLVTGQFRYYMEADCVYIENINTPGTFTAVSGLPSTGAGHYYTDITANGQYVFLACGTSGIYYFTIGTSSPTVTHYVIQTSATSTGQVGYTFTRVYWGADVLWATGEQHVYVFGASTNGNSGAAHVGGAAVNSAETLPDVKGVGWVWTNMVEGNSQIYVGGYYVASDGTHAANYGGAVYRIGQQILTALPTGLTTTTFIAPVSALPLTPGEYPTALFQYLNYIVVGTNLGVRLCETLSLYDPTATSTGDLKGGALVPNTTQPVTNPVTSFTAAGRFIYFAWANYDSTSTGIGRLDVTNFIDELTPAYCSDLMVTAQAAQIDLEWDAVNNAPLICLSNASVNATCGSYIISSNLVSSATLNSGWTTYGIADDKIIVRGHFGYNVPDGGATMSTIYSDAEGQISPTPTFLFTESSATAGGMGQVWNLPEFIRGEKFQYVVTLTRDPVTNSAGPVLARWTMFGMPAVSSETTISPVLLLFRSAMERDQAYYYDPYVEYYKLDTWRRNQTVVEYVEGPLSAQVIITSIDWLPEKEQGTYKRGYDSVAVVYLQTINGFTFTPQSVAAQ